MKQLFFLSMLLGNVFFALAQQSLKINVNCDNPPSNAVAEKKLQLFDNNNVEIIFKGTKKNVQDYFNNCLLKNPSEKSLFDAIKPISAGATTKEKYFTDSSSKK